MADITLNEYRTYKEDELEKILRAERMKMLNQQSFEKVNDKILHILNTYLRNRK